MARFLAEVAPLFELSPARRAAAALKLVPKPKDTKGDKGDPGEAVVSGALAAVGEMIGSSAGVATVSGSMGAVAEAVGAAAGVATVNGSLAAVLGTVGSSVVGAGGGDIIVNQIFAVLD